MPEILRSLLVVLLLATGIFYAVRKYAVPLGLKLDILRPRIAAWYLITCAAFLSHNFWLFIAITGVVLYKTAKMDKNPFALVLFVLYAVPLFSVPIPGAGIVNYLFDLNYFRLIALVILFPLYLKFRRNKETISFGKTWPDKFIATYLLYSLFLVFPSTTLSNWCRLAFVQFIDVFLPYYVASRCLKSLVDFDDAIQSLLIATSIAALIAVVEYAKGWLLYSAVPHAQDVVWAYGGYLRRGESLRALASAGQAIVLGYTMAMALGLYAYLAARISIPKIKYAIYALLGAGLFAPVSRGPWVGAAFIFVLLVLLGPSPTKRLIKIGFGILIPGVLFLFTPWGSKFVNYLPFVGTVDAETVTYRQDLLTNSWQVIRDNFWFGSPDFMNTEEMESMRAGANGGIIDLVNSYVAIALSGGIVGLFFFAGFFIASVWSVFKSTRVLKNNSELHWLGKSLLATSLGSMVIIYTVSSILVIPIVYWMLGGLCIAYSGMVWSANENTLSPHEKFKR